HLRLDLHVPGRHLRHPVEVQQLGDRCDRPRQPAPPAVGPGADQRRLPRDLRHRHHRLVRQPAAAQHHNEDRAPAQAGGIEPPHYPHCLPAARRRRGVVEILMPSLRIHLPGQGPKILHLWKKITTLGSGTDCDIVLPDPLLADSYAHLHHDGRDFWITAIEKRDELVINGKKRKKHRLVHQDRLTVGPIELVFSLFDDKPPVEEEAASTVADLDAYRKLYEFSARLMQNYDLPGLLNALMDLVIQITSADKGFLILVEGGQLDVKVARNLKRENISDAVS